MKNKIQKILSFLLVFSFVGCGGGGSSSGGSEQSKTISIIGKVIDGYIKDAQVCLDLNSNGTCEDSEPSTTSASDGSYSFSLVKVSSDANIISIISKGGFDTASEENYEGELKDILDTSSLQSGSTSTLTTNPFRDLLASEYISFKDKESLSSVKSKITTVFSIVNLDANPMEDKAFFIKTQELEHIKNILDVVILKKENSSLSEEEKRVYKNKIKSSILKTIKESQAYYLVVDDLLLNIEEEFTYSIPTNEKTYIKNQISETKSVLASLSSSDEIANSKLDNIQLVLNKELKISYEKLKIADINSVLEVVELSNVRKEILKGTISLSSPKNKSYSTPPSVPSVD